MAYTFFNILLCTSKENAVVVPAHACRAGVVHDGRGVFNLTKSFKEYPAHRHCSKKGVLSKSWWGEDRLLLVLQEPKHAQPQLFWQPRQARRPFGSESSHHGGPNRGDACFAHNPVAVSKRCWREPPQPELNARPRLGVRRCPECSRHVCKTLVIVESTRKLRDNVVRGPDSSSGKSWSHSVATGSS